MAMWRHTTDGWKIRSERYITLTGETHQCGE
jgi:hypothetical protein